MGPEDGAGHQDLRRAVRFRVPRAIVRETQLFLRRQGRTGHEGWVLLAGKLSKQGDTFEIIRAIIPEQSTSGIHAHVSRDEVARVALDLEQSRECIGAQIHSHPGVAFHSSVDDEGALVTKIGGLSIVVPDFGRAAIESFEHCAVFRLTTHGWHGPLRTGAVSELIEIGEEGRS